MPPLRGCAAMCDSVTFLGECPECGGDIAVEKGNEQVAVCLDCEWYGQLAVTRTDD